MHPGELCSEQVGVDFEEVAEAIEREDAMMPAKVHPARTSSNSLRLAGDFELIDIT